MNNRRSKPKRLGLVIITLLISLLLVMPVMANSPVSYGNGDVEVDNVEPNETTFSAFRIFKATENTDGSLSDFQWENEDIRDSVLSVINEFDSSYSSENAQDAAEFISEAYRKISSQWDSEMTTSSTTVLRYSELLNQIAEEVSQLSGGTSIEAGTSTELGEGYWVIVTGSDSVGTGENGTSPIYVVLGDGESITINEKTKAPVSGLFVMDDSKGNTYSDTDSSLWGLEADAERGQSVVMKVTGTISGNYITYDEYGYELKVHLAEGVDMDSSVEWKVYLYDEEPKDGEIPNRHDITDAFTESSSKGTDKIFAVKTDDLKDCGFELNPDSFIILTYNVKLNDKAEIGAAGNKITSEITYSSNPNTEHTSDTLESVNYIYTYGMDAYKKDRDTNEALEKAEFIIQAVADDGTPDGSEFEDEVSLGKYILKDGTFGSEDEAKADPFISDVNGKISVNGLDAGTYRIIETKAPEGFRWHTDTTVFKISCTYDSEGKLVELANTVSQNNDAAAGIDTKSDDSEDGNHRNIVKGDEGTGAILSSGLVNITIGNIRKINLPLTGEAGVVWIFAIGTALMLLSVLGFFLSSNRRRKYRNEK